MAAEPQSVLGELATLGIAKETSFGKRPASFTGGVWHAFKTWSGKLTTQQVAKAPRGSLANAYPATGGRSGAGSLDVETDADTFPMILAYSLGAQTLHTADVLYAGTLVGSGLVSIGGTSCTVSPNTQTGGGISNRPPLLIPGMSMTIDAGGSHPEPVTITGVTPGANPFLGTIGATVTFTPATAFTHVAGATISTGATSKTLNYMKLGTPLPTFTTEVNRPTGGGAQCNDYLGCKIDSLALSLAAKQGFTAKASLVFQDMQVQASPATASVSSLNPYVFEQQFVQSVFCGEILSSTGASSLQNLSITLNNNLLKDNHVGGNGNLVWNFPEQVRSVSGSVTLGFESLTEYTAAEAAAAGGALPPVSLLVPLVSTDIIGGAVPYSIWLYFPKIFLGDWTPNDDSSKVLTQTMSLTCAESAPGAYDNMQAYCITGATAIY